MPITINNVAQPTGESRNVLGHGELEWYRWRVWVDEPREKLDEIKSVEYLLHPTFPVPKKVATDREHQFELIGSGWGQFWIAATIIFNNFQEETVRHYLDFNKQGVVPERS